MEKYEKKVMNLKDAIAYEDHSIVSKTISTNGNASFTLFAFDSEIGIDSHVAPVDAVVYVIEGEMDVVISDASFIVRQGEFILMPKGAPHSLLAKTKAKMALFKV